MATVEKEWIVVSGLSELSENGFSSLMISENNVVRAPNIDELERAALLLNEESSTVVKIFCRNAKCPGLGSWIQRTRPDIAKNIYSCDLCNQPMVR